MLTASELKLFDKIIDKRDEFVIVEDILKNFFMVEVNEMLSTPTLYSICKNKNIIDYNLIKDTIEHLISTGILLECPPQDCFDMREKWYAITSIGLSEW